MLAVQRGREGKEWMFLHGLYCVRDPADTSFQTFASLWSEAFAAICGNPGSQCRTPKAERVQVLSRLRADVGGSQRWLAEVTEFPSPSSQGALCPPTLVDAASPYQASPLGH